VARVWETASGKEVFSSTSAGWGVNGIVLSRGGARLAVLQYQGRELSPGEGVRRDSRRLVVWDVAARKEILSLSVPAASQLLLSADGKRVATDVFDRALGGFQGRVLKVWEVEGGKEPRAPIKPGTGHVQQFALSPDGKHLATAALVKAPDQTLVHEIHIWDVEAGNRQTALRWPADPSEAAAPRSLEFQTLTFSPDGTRVAAIRRDGRGTSELSSRGVVWEAADGKILATFRPVAALAHQLVFSPDGKRLATWTAERASIGQVWDAATGAPVLTLKGHTEPVVALAFNADGTRLSSADKGRNIKVWDATARDAGEPAPERGAAVACARDSSRRVVYSPPALQDPGRDTISVRDASGRETLAFHEHKAPVWAARLSPDGRHVLSFDRAGELKVWDAETGAVRLAQKWPAFTPRAPRMAPSFSDDGRRLALGTPAGTVEVWDLFAGKAVFTCAVNTLAPDLSPDGRRLVTTPTPPEGHSGEIELTLWDVEAGKSIGVWTGRFRGVLFSRDGRRLAARVNPADYDARKWTRNSPVEVKVFDAVAGAELAHLKGDLAWGPMALSPDGRFVVTSARTTSETLGDLLIVDVAGEKEPRRLKGHGNLLSDLAMSPDGTRIASLAQSPTLHHAEIKLWDATTGIEVLNLKAPWAVNREQTLAFSRDGRRLLTATTSGEFLQTWDATPRAEPGGK
jgi:WD40 repeat protein